MSLVHVICANFYKFMLYKKISPSRNKMVLVQIRKLFTNIEYHMKLNYVSNSNFTDSCCTKKFDSILDCNISLKVFMFKVRFFLKN